MGMFVDLLNVYVGRFGQLSTSLRSGGPSPDLSTAISGLSQLCNRLDTDMAALMAGGSDAAAAQQDAVSAGDLIGPKVGAIAAALAKSESADREKVAKGASIDQPALRALAGRQAAVDGGFLANVQGLGARLVAAVDAAKSATPSKAS
ncbi:MAG: hypothetical protein H7841_07100 [Magnetospirillum sp. WYHS-4]